MKSETLILNKERNVTLTVYLQPVGGEFQDLNLRPAVLILPGGGYHFCSDREADPVAFAYLKAGYHVFILRYSLGDCSVWPNPLSDYEQAITLIRHNAGEWHVAADRIAVLGFSAGGHLAACAATMAENRPNAAILGYPVITGETVRDYCPSAPDAADAVDDKTCPCFIFTTRTDNLVPVENTLRFLAALERKEIAFESHIYASGPHGLSTGESSLCRDGYSSRYPNWVADSISWLSEVLGGLGPQGLKEPVFGAKINGNREEFLNLDCTFQYLANHPEARALPFLTELENSDIPMPPAARNVVTLRDCLTYSGASEEKIQAIEASLKAIKNGKQYRD